MAAPVRNSPETDFSTTAETREAAEMCVPSAHRAAELLAIMQASLEQIESLHARVKSQLDHSELDGGASRRPLSPRSRPAFQSGADACARFYSSAAALHALHVEETSQPHTLNGQTRRALVERTDAEAREAQLLMEKLEPLEGVFMEERIFKAQLGSRNSDAAGTLPRIRLQGAHPSLDVPAPASDHPVQ